MQEITTDLSINTAAHAAYTELDSKYIVTCNLETVFQVFLLLFFFNSTFAKRVYIKVIYVFKCQLVCSSLYSHKLPIKLHKELCLVLGHLFSLVFFFYVCMYVFLFHNMCGTEVICTMYLYLNVFHNMHYTEMLFII